MPFSHRQKVLFRPCDPAGIVFYPRYFEMMNDTVEEFFSAVVSVPLESLLKHGGTPTVRIESTFQAPSRHGEELEISLECTRLGRTSLDLTYEATCGSERRFSAKSTLVHVDGNGKSKNWPDPVRAVLEHQVQGED